MNKKDMLNVLQTMKDEELDDPQRMEVIEVLIKILLNTNGDEIEIDKGLCSSLNCSMYC